MNRAIISSEGSAQTHVNRTVSGSRSGGRLLRRTFIFAFVLASGGLLTGSVGAEERAQPIKIGVLTIGWGPTPATVGLRDGLLKLGYRENEDFVIGVRFTQGDLGALPAAAHDVVKYGVDIIFATSDGAQAAQQATSQIPIVFAEVNDPLRAGLIQSFARPGRNITGVTDLHLELSPKRLELFREIVPSLKRVLFLYDANHAHGVVEAEGYRAAARRLGIELVERPVRTQEEAWAVLTQIRRDKIDGILAPYQASLNIPGFILEAASQQAVPTMFDTTWFVESGGLAQYGPEYYESGRQAARLVDKIVKGAKPAEIPVEVNAKIEFVINLKVAKALGLTIAPEVLYRADRIIR